MAEIPVDTSRMPIVVTRLPSEYGAPEMERMFDQIRALYDAEQQHISVSDISLSAAITSAGHRKIAADFTRSERDRAARFCLGSVIVAPSRLLRGAITAIHWANPPPYPQVTVATMDEAMAWAEAKCAELGLTPR